MNHVYAYNNTCVIAYHNFHRCGSSHSCTGLFIVFCSYSINSFSIPSVPFNDLLLIRMNYDLLEKARTALYPESSS